jgi:large subunit ribosomal protein L32e
MYALRSLFSPALEFIRLLDVVHNIQSLDLLMMHNKSFAAEIAHNVSSKKRIAILEKAKILGVKVTNSGARVRVEEA